MNRTRQDRTRRRGALLVVAALLTSVLAACGNNSTDPNTIRFALDWTPNTNHTGLFVALQEGYFADAGLDVQVLPYNNTSPDTLIDSGNAEAGISFQSSSTFAKAAGADIVSVLAPLQHWATGIGVRADRADIASPRDLDGKTYAGFGDAGEVETLKQVIRNDGGTGEFRNVTLGTSAYEAVYSGQADFTVPYIAWEAIEAQHNGTPFKIFDYTDYGFPDAYAIVVNAGNPWLTEHPEQARKFVQALQKGYQLAADDPARGAQDLIDANPGAFTDEAMVRESQDMLAAKYMKDENGRVGTQTLDRWTGYSRLLYEHGLLVDESGKPLTAEPDWSTYFTDDYLDRT
ncbi:ABC transporter substrate-binding protein [Aldersonia sp. NBC_00410]|uniref:ABC transporter substrate-binding protein n=1 Tax=Aldersonia sp. NBC_00410 TaxID=2975954 RepID=UPI00224F1CB2|nr:ABC transporter substrate-binding protein [Aldersonia sp. NBC_00410]MCX5043646.1 ABC transporter substrate-binding protein [Aldersonia sp. NBC_00410]